MQKYQMEVLMLAVESNHEHLVVYDRLGNYPEFAEYLHKLIARSQNALRGRCENFWSSEEMCAVRLINREDVIAKMIYTAANPVQDRLVERVHKWPGINGYVHLLNDRAFIAKRSGHFFRPDGPMPASVTFRMTIPPELGDAADIKAQVRAGVQAIEDALALEIRGGARVVGARNIVAQDWRASPTTVEPRRNLRPRFAAANRDDRIAALEAYRAFLDAYREARRRWTARIEAVFPMGTYWLRRFAAVPIAGAA